MKKLFTLLLASTMMCGSLFAQYQKETMSLELPTNKNTELVYCYTVKSQDSVRATTFASQLQKLIQSENLAISYRPCLDSLCDVIYDIDNQKITPQKALKALKKRYYTGQRPEVSTVFAANVDGYPEFRIPSVVSMGDGRVLAFIEARAHASHDQAENDMLVRISEDGGKNWGKIIVIDSQGEASLNNPCAVYVPQTGEVLVMYQSFPAKTTEASVGSGYDGAHIVRTFISSSKDGGQTWSTPEDITRQTKTEDMLSICCGPGVGVVTDKGRIVMPFNANGASRWHNYLVYSDDNGRSWKMSEGMSDYGTNESQMVHIGGNEFLVNARSHRFVGDNSREKAPQGWSPWNFERVTRNRANMYVTLDEKGVSTWQPTQVMANQPDPTCQGSVLKLHSIKGKPLLLSNPANQLSVFRPDRNFAGTPPMRMNGTVRVSYDNGQTWKASKRIYGDPLTEYQYSVLTDLGDGMVGCIFEANGIIKFARFSLDWLEQN